MGPLLPAFHEAYAFALENLAALYSAAGQAEKAEAYRAECERTRLEAQELRQARWSMGLG